MNETFMTAYRAAKELNEVLTEAGLKTVPPQMIYNYVSKNLIPSEVVDGQRVVRKSAFHEWAEKYVAKKLDVVADLEAK